MKLTAGALLLSLIVFLPLAQASAVCPAGAVLVGVTKGSLWGTSLTHDSLSIFCVIVPEGAVSLLSVEKAPPEGTAGLRFYQLVKGQKDTNATAEDIWLQKRSDHSVFFYDLKAKKEIAAFATDAHIDRMVRSPDRRYVAFLTSTRKYFWLTGAFGYAVPNVTFYLDVYDMAGTAVVQDKLVARDFKGGVGDVVWLQEKYPSGGNRPD
jgi:hypothetical protein